jgi:hypothetical protein
MPAAQRAAPVMAGWNQVPAAAVVPAADAAVPAAAAAAAAAAIPVAVVPTAIPAAAAAVPVAAVTAVVDAATGGNAQFESLQLTPEGAGPAGVAAQAAEQAMALEGQQQDLAVGLYKLLNAVVTLA